MGICYGIPLSAIEIHFFDVNSFDYLNNTIGLAPFLSYMLIGAINTSLTICSFVFYDSAVITDQMIQCKELSVLVSITAGCSY